MKDFPLQIFLTWASNIGFASPTPPRPRGWGNLTESLGDQDRLIWQGWTPAIDLPEAVVGCPKDYPEFIRPGVPPCEVSVAILNGARVFGPSVAVCSSRNLLLRDISIEWGDRKVPWVMRKFRFAQPRYLKGRSILLASTGGETYFHFLFDVLPRLELIRRSGLSFSSEDRFLVNSLDPAFVKPLLDKLGIPPERCVETCRQKHLICEELVVPSLPGQIGSPHKNIAEFYDQLFPRALPSLFCRGPGLFLSRTSARQRQIKQYDSVQQILSTHRIETVDMGRLPIDQQVEKIRRASFVVAPHGAALSNLVFCQSGTPVLELFSPRYINQCYRVLAATRKLPYAYLVGRADGPAARPNRSGDASGDLVFDMDTFREAIETIFNLATP